MLRGTAQERVAGKNGSAQIFLSAAQLVKQAGSIPCEIKRMAIDGNLAFVHVRIPNWAGKEYAGVDIFRFDADGKILEHWDVLQPVPAAASNDNTMF